MLRISQLSNHSRLGSKGWPIGLPFRFPRYDSSFISIENIETCLGIARSKIYTNMNVCGFD